MSQQQTVLKVQTNIQSGTSSNPDFYFTLNPGPSFSYNISYSGTGTLENPISGTSTYKGDYVLEMSIRPVDFDLNPYFSGTLYYEINNASYTGSSIDLYSEYYTRFNIYNLQNDDLYEINPFYEYGIQNLNGSFKIDSNTGSIDIYSFLNNTSGLSTFTLYFVPDPIPNQFISTYDTLDLYDDIPIKINKSFAELQDISKRNSDYSVGLTIPGSKKNNRFFENFYDVDSATLFFDVTKRVPCQILIDDQSYFNGYLKLNKVSVQNSKVEYDVTLYSIVGDLFGKIGNSLLKDLNFNDTLYHFNHYFNIYNVTADWRFSVLQQRNLPLWTYPVVHNGYNYSGDTVNLSGTTSEETRLYTTTVVSGFTTYGDFNSSGGKEYRINSPTYPILDNQLKPSLNMYSLIQLMFKTYGYTIKSDFFKTPWFKLLYMYGYFSSDVTKFSYYFKSPQQFGYEGVQIMLYAPVYTVPQKVYVVVVKTGTGIPCWCSDDISFSLSTNTGVINQTIQSSTSGSTITLASGQYVIPEPTSLEVTTRPYGSSLAYDPIAPNTYVPFVEGDYVDFSLVIDEKIKQIDLLASIAKKFNLVFIPDPDVPNQIIIEPYTYYIGSGDIHDWTEKISFDKGFTVEPALNYIESEIYLTDQEDGDDGNKQFKDKNNRLYGENYVYNETDFKSQQKKIDTIFSPEIIRNWDSNVGIPLGINYAASSQLQTIGETERVVYYYKGIKSKPKLMYNLGNLSPFLDKLGESFDLDPTHVNTMFFRLQTSDATNPGSTTYALPSYVNPVVSHTMPMGNNDDNKKGRGFENDSICNLFNSEEPIDYGLGILPYNTYTENDIYNLFYQNRINNLYDKSTRFLNGNFYLKLSDIKNLKPHDLIKIKDQYFTWNKVDSYNLTNKELTKVELIQFNSPVNTYPTRYFQYQYCGDSTIYKFKTVFTPDNNYFYKTYFHFSILYDYFIGVLGGNATGFTSSYTSMLSYNQYDPYNKTYAYSIWEVDSSTYESSGIEHIYDPNDDAFINFDNLAGIAGSNPYGPTLSVYQGQNIYAFANQTGYTNAFFNLATGCTQFSGFCTTNHVTLSPAPTQIPVSPTPTPTPSATPSTSDRMIGSLLMTFDEYIDDRGLDYYQVSVNGDVRDLHYTDTTDTYSTYLYTGDSVNIIVSGDTFTTYKIIDVVRRDYTTDDQGGDKGIRDTFITGYTGTSISSESLTFTIPNLPLDYNFEYRVTVRTAIPASPTPTPTVTPTPTITPTLTPTTTPTPTPTRPAPDGRFRIVGGTTTDQSTIYLSNDYGATYSQISGLTGYTGFTNASISSDGQIMWASNKHYLYKSNNYGNTWTQVTTPGDHNWVDVQVSQNGQYVTALDAPTGSPGTGGMYTSTDYGVTWNIVSGSTVYQWQNVTITRNGFPQYATNEQVQYPWILTSSGSTLASYTGLSNSYIWRDIKVSNLNQYYLACNSDGNSFLSTNSGSTYTQISSPTGTTQPEIDMSLSGQYMVITDDNTRKIYVSSNYGSSFTGVTPAVDIALYDIAVDGSGQFMVAAGPSEIYQSSNYGSSWTRKSFSGSNIDFCAINKYDSTI